MRSYLTYFVLIIMCFLSAQSLGQDTTKVEKEKVIVVKHDGGTYTGFILTDDAREVLLESDQVGRLYLPKHMIKSIETYNPQVHEMNNEVQEQPITNEPQIKIEKKDSNDLENYISTKNILSDNAFPLRRGEAYIKLMPLGFEAGIPLTKNWSIHPFASYWGLPVGFKTKFCQPFTESAYMSLDIGYGSMAFGSWADLGIENGGGVISTTFTFGDRTKNVSVKAGYGLIHEQWMDWEFDENTQMWVESGLVTDFSHLIFANVGGMFQVNPRTYFVFDALLATINGEVIIGGGAAGRWGRNPRRQWQVGGSLLFSTDSFLPFPLLNASYTFVLPKRNQL